MTPTKATIDKWKPESLTIPGIGALGKTIATESSAADRLYDLPHSEWDGAARTAATLRAGNESAWARRVGAKVEALGKSLKSAGAAISPMVTAVHSALQTAAADHCSLISDHDASWAMKYSPPTSDDDLSAAKIAEKERQWSAYVKARADAAEHTCRDHAGKIAAALSTLSALTPPVLGLSAQDGRRDAELGKDGWTPEELRQVGKDLVAAGLTDAQIQQLLDGGSVGNLPVGAQEYLHQFFGNLSRDELLGLKAKFDAMGTPEGEQWSESLGKGLLTLSNENVGSRGVTGGFGSLPGWAREWATTRDTKTHVPQFTTMRLAELLTNSGKMPPGERFGSELIRKSAGLAGRSDSDDGGVQPDYGFGGNDPGDSRARYESTMENLLGVGTRNHESSAAILSGTFADGSALPDDYNRDQTLRWLARHEWRDNGEGVGHLTDWIGQYADNPDHSKAALADRGFTGLFDFATTTDNAHGHNNFADLMNTNHDRDSVGQVNPEFADALRQATKPYLNYLANPSAADGITGHHGLGLTDSGSDTDFRARALRLMTLIASDDAPNGGCSPDNPDGVNTATQLSADILEQVNRNAQFAAGHDPLARALGFTSGELRELGRGGVYGAQFDHSLDIGDAVDAANEATERSKSILDSGSAIVGLIPGGSIVSGGIDAVTPWIPPTKAGDIPFHIPSGSEVFGSDNEAKQSLSSAYSVLQGSGLHGGDPDWYDHGRLKPIEQLLRESGGDASQLHQAIDEYLRRANPDRQLTLNHYDSGRDDARTTDDAQHDPTERDTYRDWIRDGSRK